MVEPRLISHNPHAGTPRELLRHYVGDLVNGANDGIVTTFAIVSGSVGAELSVGTIIILGIANLLADGISMGASTYLAIRSTAAAERQNRGIAEPLKHAAATYLAFVVGGATPLIIYTQAYSPAHAYLAASIAAAVAMFAVGSLRSLVSHHGWLRSGLEMLLVGVVAGSVAWIVGRSARGLV